MPSRRERTHKKKRLLFRHCCGSNLPSRGYWLACHLPVGGECSAISHTAQPEVSSGRVCGIIAWTRQCESKKSFTYRERKCLKSVCFLNLNVKTFLLFVSCLSFFFAFGKAPQWQAGAGQTKSNYHQAGMVQAEAAIN